MPSEVDIQLDRIAILRENGVAVKRLAELCSASVNTTKRRVCELPGTSESSVCQPDDYETDETNTAEIVQKALLEELHISFQRPEGSEAALAVKVSKTRPLRGYRQVRPATNEQPHGALKGRVYGVQGPLSLVRTDGNHTLIKWKLVIHGAIDAYSRLVTYLDVATDKKASTVYRLFLKSVANWGVPSRVRSDYGDENIKIADYMVAKRGRDRGSYILGKSVHNTSIEQLWKGVNQYTKLFGAWFENMEYHRILDPECDTDLFALHYVFIPLIRESLEIFVIWWNNHPIRAIHYKTPIQTFHSGLDNLAAQVDLLPDEHFPELFQPLKWTLEALDLHQHLSNHPDEGEGDSLITRAVPDLLKDPRYAGMSTEFRRDQVNLQNAVDMFKALKAWIREREFRGSAFA